MYKSISKAVSDFSSLSPARFFMPGHKGKYPEKLLDPALDITELDFSDNLLNPSGIIAEAQKKAEACFGGKCFFSTCGSTVPILAALSLFKKKRILMQRNSHISVYNALDLFDITPDFIPCRVSNGLIAPVGLKDIEAALKDDISAVVITVPDYYGQTADVGSIYAFLKEKGIILIIDGAHAAHFTASKLLPPFPEGDITVASLHKTLPALTSAAMAVVYNRNLTEKFKCALNKLHTTSPSYLILSSAEYAADYASDSKREKDYSSLFDNINALKKSSRRIKYLDNQDFTRVVADISETGLSGKEGMKILEKHNVYCEFADERRLVFIATPFNSEEDFAKLNKALSEIEREKHHDNGKEIYLFPKSEFAMPYKAALSAEWEEVELVNAENRISAVNAGIYPPSVPVLLAGEWISRNHIKYIINTGSDTFGISGGKIKVVKNER